MSLLQTIFTAADAVRGRIGDRQPQVGIVLGSGLGKLADQIEDPVAVPYEEIPGFPGYLLDRKMYELLKEY